MYVPFKITGVLEMEATWLYKILLISDDFPTFERPANKISRGLF